MAGTGIATDQTAEQILAIARGIASDMADSLDRAAALQRYVTGVGVAGLEVAGFTTDGGALDVNDFMTKVGYMAQLSGIAEGLLALQAAFNFANALAPLAGPPKAP